MNTKEIEASDVILIPIIFRFVLPPRIIRKCLDISSKEDIEDEDIDTLCSYYFDTPPEKKFKGGRLYKPVNIKKIVNEYLDERAKGIEIQNDPDWLSKEIIDKSDDTELFGLLLWKLFRKSHKDPKYKKIAQSLVLDGFLIKILITEISAIRSMTQTFKNTKDKYEKQREELEEKRREVFDLKNKVIKLERESNKAEKPAIETIKKSKIKNENKKLKERINQLKNQINILKEAEIKLEKTKNQNKHLDSKLNKIRSALPGVSEALTKAKKEIKHIRSDMQGLDKAVKIKQDYTSKKSEQTLDFFIDSYDLWYHTNSNRQFDFKILNKWIHSYFTEHRINQIILLVRPGDKKKNLIREAIKENLKVKLVPQQSWISTITCEILESKTDTICLSSSNLQFSAITKALNRQRRKFFLVFPKTKISNELQESNFINLDQKNYTRRKHEDY